MGSLPTYITILPIPEIRIRNRIFVKIRCNCGVEKYARRDRVVSGNLKSCGCVRRQRKNFITFNKRFISLKSACEESKISACVVYQRAKRRNCSLQEAFDYYSTKVKA